MKPEGVLIVDDDPGIVEVLETFLKLIGCPCDFATNGRDALTQIGRKRPRLVLLDLRMPIMDGFTFLRLLREQQETRDIAVIIMTAYQDAAQIASTLPVQGSIQKPFDLDAIERLVHEAIPNCGTPETT